MEEEEEEAEEEEEEAEEEEEEVEVEEETTKTTDGLSMTSGAEKIVRLTSTAKDFAVTPF